MMQFDDFFSSTNGFEPHPWQAQLGAGTACEDRLIRIPTGLGKTTGIGTAWLYHRVHLGDMSWPTRLVWVLPMRTLVEQTLTALAQLVQASGLDVRVVPCMGGLVEKEYAVRPELPTILVGTQDMLVSRMLNRGYAAARGRWPIDFGLLSRDVLMVCDEIQLMDASLATTAQLTAFRGGTALRPSKAWWMSATLQPDWLNTVDLAPRVPALAAACARVPPEEQHGGMWDNHKVLSLRPEWVEPKDLAAPIAEAHAPGTLTLVILNRVDRAVELQKLLVKKTNAVVELVHSRFRPAERADWITRFLSKNSPLPVQGRIIVSTQVVEAGVDISANLLVTDLAPWASLVQRFGRAARYSGQSADVWVVGAAPEEGKKALPYSSAELQAASRALQELIRGDSRVGLGDLERFERGLSASEIVALYPPPGGQVLRRRDVFDLFDTTPDLSGADLDIAPFIRSSETRDLSVFWREPDQEPPSPKTLPRRDELCSVPIGAGKKWLEKVDRWWLLDFNDGWERGSRRTLAKVAPGRIIWVHPEEGGYSLQKGFDPKAKSVEVVPEPAVSPEQSVEISTATEDDEELSVMSQWRSIATHCSEASDFAKQIGSALQIEPRLVGLIALAARWHDVGKSHPVFQACIKDDARTALRHEERQDLAKAPRGSWAVAKRRGFRHELASGLALFALLRRAQPDHPALRGAVLETLDALGWLDNAVPDLTDHPIAAELASLTAEEVDLVLWLVVTHHGKVRSSLVSTPHDQKDMAFRGDGKVQIHGVCDGDSLPPLAVASRSGPVKLPAIRLDLAPSQVGLDMHFGRSWNERANDLLKQWGPFDLAYLEALLRASDVRASQLTTIDPEVS